MSSAGHLNPRQLVAAQQKIAASVGCQIFRDVVASITPEAEAGFVLACTSGIKVRAKKIVIAAGVYSGLDRVTR
jgi:glycine/D-amino acid oxidase-like deaminating enzyme